MKITRLRVRSYRGIEELDATVPPGGMVAKGGNGRGKTSILKAIRAALAAQDIGDDAIRIGADKAEILVDLDSVKVRRSITKGGGGLTVTQDLGAGVRAALGSPQSYLTTLLGTSALDPLALFLAKPKDRRATILAALPVKVTIEQLRKWAPDLPESTDVSGHGLDVVARVRKAYYDARTEANAVVKKARTEADRRKAEADELAAKWSGPAIPIDQAELLHERAKNELAALDARLNEWARATERTAKSRARVVQLRDNAAHEVEGMTAPKEQTIAEARTLVADLTKEHSDLALKLEKKAAQLAQAELALRTVEARAAMVKAANDRATSLRAQADELEETIAEASVAAPSEDEIAGAERAVNQASAGCDDARRAALAVEARRIADEAAKIVLDVTKRADALDDIVVALTNDAPAQLLADSNGIPGLTLDGDDIKLDGVSLVDGLSGRERLEFAIEVARRANAKSKILVVDGLEQLDPDEYATFVEKATADGYQLIASRVDRGDMVLEAIEPEARNGAGAQAAEVSP